MIKKVKLHLLSTRLQLVQERNKRRGNLCERLQLCCCQCCTDAGATLDAGMEVQRHGVPVSGDGLAFPSGVQWPGRGVVGEWPGMENWNQDHPERYSNFCGLYIKF